MVNDGDIAIMVMEDPCFLDEQRTLYQSMRSTHEICRGRWWLRVLRVERDALFAEIDAEVTEEDTQATDLSWTVPTLC